MTREEALLILNDLNGKYVHIGPYLVRASDVAWSLVDRWLVMDLRLVSQGPISQTLPASPSWLAIATAFGLDGLTTTDRGGVRETDLQARLWATFA